MKIRADIAVTSHLSDAQELLSGCVASEHIQSAWREIERAKAIYFAHPNLNDEVSTEELDEICRDC